MTTTTRQQEQSEATRAALITAARKLFARDGYGGVATEAIVASARVTRGALYHHFRDKRDLFHAVYDEVEEELLQRIAKVALVEEDPWRRLTAAFDAFLEACIEPDIQRIVFVDAAAVLTWEEWMRADYEASAHSLTAFAIQQAVDAGVMRAADVDVLAHLVLGALNSAGRYIAQANDTKQAKERVGRAMVAWLEGLRTG